MNTISTSELKMAISYDPDTGLFTWIKSASRKRINGKRAGSIQPTGYIAISIGRRKYLAHRLAWLYMFGSMPADCIDHINGDRADNRICNIREASRKQNNHNTQKFCPNISGYTGVSRYRNKWRARIKVDGKENISATSIPEKMRMQPI